MKLAPAKVLVNAAFLSEIKEDNRRLRQLLQSANRCFRRPDVESLPDVIRLLWELRDQLGMHFALENAYGYLADVVDFAPRLCDRAQQMLREHDAMFLSMCEMIDRAEELMYEGATKLKVRRLARDYFRFAEEFAAHEARENELIFDAFDDDIGVGD